MNTSNNSDSSQSTWTNGPNHTYGNDYFAWAKTPGFNPVKAAAVVAGFAIFPPVGAAALLYFIWKSRRAYAAGPFGTPDGGPRGRWAGRMGCGGPMGRHGRGPRRWTGNAAFDEYQAEAIDKLRAEREAFWTFRAEQRRKRDQEAFEAFRAAQAKPDESQKPQ